MSTATQQATVMVDQPKVSLHAITPLIWRRLLVTSVTTIAQLHDSKSTNYRQLTFDNSRLRQRMVYT